MIDVSIIIVNYNTCKVTLECIESIFHHTENINFEIILVDNNSKDESFSVFSKDNRIIYLYQSENLGFGKANNIGYKYAKGKYLFLLNSDTLLKSNAVKEFYDYMEKAPKNISCVGTILKDINNNINVSYNSFPTFWTGIDWFTILGSLLRKLRIIKNSLPKRNSDIVDFISGADIFMRKDIADKFGLFDPDFFMYFEETEMQFRYRNKGYSSIIYDVPQIIHLESFSVDNSYSGRNFRKLGMSLVSYYSYLYKCKGKFIYYLFRLIYAIISPLWIIHPKYTFKDKVDFIKLAYRNR